MMVVEGVARDARDRLFYALVALAIAAGVARRLLIGWDAPLWFDEAVTGAIAIQPTVAGLVEDCLNELGGPVYYIVMWCWTKLFGASDIALRVPSFLFAIAAPLVIAWKGHSDHRIRLTWAALAALWLPGFYYATEARSYSLLFLLGSVQVILFARLLASPTLRRANAWTALSTLLILTHTHGALLAGIQGLMLLAVHRQRALKLWPAALLLAPAALWILIHLPLLVSFSDPKVAWQRLLQPEQLLGVPGLLFGNSPVAPALAVFVLGITIWAAGRAAGGTQRFGYGKDDLLPVLASVLTIAIVIGAGFFSPTFTPRYLILMIPGFLLGISLWANGWGPRSWFPAGLIAVFLIMCLTDTALRMRDPKLDFRRGYSWDEASDFLRAEGVQHLIFVWDNPTAAIADRGQLGRVGGFFLHRDGVPVSTDTVGVATGSDAMFQRATFAAAAAGEAARRTVGVVTLGRKLDLSQADPAWRCRIFGGPEQAYDADVLVTACVRPPITPPRAIPS